MKYAVIVWICENFVINYDYLQEKQRIGEKSSFSVWPAMRLSADHKSIFDVCSETSAESRKAQCMCPLHSRCRVMFVITHSLLCSVNSEGLQCNRGWVPQGPGIGDIKNVVGAWIQPLCYQVRTAVGNALHDIRGIVMPNLEIIDFTLSKSQNGYINYNVLWKTL